LLYFAPVCALMNFVVALFWEIPSLQWSEVQAVGFPIFLLNGCAAWALNCSVVFLVWSPFLSVPSNTLIIFPDRENIRSCTHTLWCIERYPPRRRLHLDLRNLCHPYTVVRLQHRPCWTCRLQVWNDWGEGRHCRWYARLERVWRKPTHCSQNPRYRSSHRHNLSSPGWICAFDQHICLPRRCQGSCGPIISFTAYNKITFRSTSRPAGGRKGRAKSSLDEF